MVEMHHWQCTQFSYPPHHRGNPYIFCRKFFGRCRGRFRFLQQRFSNQRRARRRRHHFRSGLHKGVHFGNMDIWINLQIPPQQCFSRSNRSCHAIHRISKYFCWQIREMQCRQHFARFQLGKTLHEKRRGDLQINSNTPYSRIRTALQNFCRALSSAFFLANNFGRQFVSKRFIKNRWFHENQKMPEENPFWTPCKLVQKPSLLLRLSRVKCCGFAHVKQHNKKPTQ